MNDSKLLESFLVLLFDCRFQPLRESSRASTKGYPLPKTPKTLSHSHRTRSAKAKKVSASKKSVKAKTSAKTKKSAKASSAKAITTSPSRLSRLGRRIKALFSRSTKATKASVVRVYRSSAKAASSVLNAVKAAFDAFIRGLKAAYRWVVASAATIATAVMSAFAAVGRFTLRCVVRLGELTIGNLVWYSCGAYDKVVYHAPRLAKRVATVDFKRVVSYVGRILWTGFWVVLSTSLILSGMGYISGGFVVAGVLFIALGLWGYTGEWNDFVAALRGRDSAETIPDMRFTVPGSKLQRDTFDDDDSILDVDDAVGA